MFFTITADPIKVTEVKKAPSLPIKQILLDEKGDKVLENISDEAEVFWADVKKAFPALEAQLKAIFGGKDRLSVGDLKKKMGTVEDDEAALWLSHVDYNDAWRIQRELPENGDDDEEGNRVEYKQIAIQLNIGPSLVKAIDADPIAQKFFEAYSKMTEGDHLHPNHTQSIAWARVYTLKDKWIIEELQSDIWGASLKANEIPDDAKAYDIINKMPKEEQSDLERFFHKHFMDWDKKLIASVINMARKAGVKDIYMWDESIKQKVTRSKSKLDKYYKIVPRDFCLLYTSDAADE